MKHSLLALGRSFGASLRDLSTIAAVVLFFQVAVIRQPFPEALTLLVGLALIVTGLTLFVRGLQMSLFPIGDALAYGLARKGSVTLLLLFSAALGFGTTVAEPALIAVANKAAQVAVEANFIAATPTAQADYAQALRLTVAVAVSLAIVIGVLRILAGWPIHWLIAGGYVVVVCITPFVPAEFIGIAYDSGGVATSTITVPLVTALGVGLASSIRGRDPLVDGFGLIAFAALMPIVFVLIFGMVYG